MYLTSGSDRELLGHSDQPSKVLTREPRFPSRWLSFQCHSHKSAPVSMIDDRDIDLRLIQNRTAELDEGSG